MLRRSTTCGCMKRARSIIIWKTLALNNHQRYAERHVVASLLRRYSLYLV